MACPELTWADYLWICLWYYQGAFTRPDSLQDVGPWLKRMGYHVYDVRDRLPCTLRSSRLQGAFPTPFAWAAYLGLGTIQLLFATFMPGIMQNGLPVPSLDYKTLAYKCNALYSWYTTLVLAYVFHVTGIFRLPWLIENFGPLMSVAIITSYIISLVIDFSARLFGYGGGPLRMSGIWVYDHFMGVPLNPRLGPVDLKIFAEVRVPWLLLFLLSLSGVVKQYEDLGRVTGNMLHMLIGTGLYMNACAKAEQLIPQTWDMFHEKFGWMLIFWNMAGV